MNKFVINKNKIITCLLVIFVAVVVSLFFDYYYDLNDDLVFKDILSGAYTGTPEGRTILMLWPFCLLISCLYRLFRSLPWYGIVLWTLHYFSLGLILYRVVSISKKLVIKVILTIITILTFCDVFLCHFVFLQFSITSAILGSVSSFWLLTIPTSLEKKKFMRESMISIVLMAFSFCIRTNMALLMLPFFCLAGLYRWSMEETPINKPNLIKYGTVIASIAVLLPALYGINKLAYTSEEWQSFAEYNKHRIEIFDMQVVPNYEENHDFYEDLGITKDEFDAFNNYNYGITKDIDNQKMESIAKLADEICINEDYVGSVIFALYSYKREVLSKNTYPLNYIVIGLYVAVLAMYLLRRDSFKKNILSVAWRLGILFAGRTSIWLFLLVKGRVPERITHSMYIVEVLILLALIINESKDFDLNKMNRQRRFDYRYVVYSITLLFLFIFVVNQIKVVKNRSYVQDAVNEYNEAVDSYCKQRSDSFFYIDVYSAIIDGWTFNEKCFKDVDNTYKNYDFLGGWTANSPLYSEKQAYSGLKGPFYDLIDNSEKVFIIVRKDRNVDWMEGMYRSKGINILLNTVDDIDGKYNVLQVSLR